MEILIFYRFLSLQVHKYREVSSFCTHFLSYLSAEFSYTEKCIWTLTLSCLPDPWVSKEAATL